MRKPFSLIVKVTGLLALLNAALAISPNRLLGQSTLPVESLFADVQSSSTVQFRILRTAVTSTNANFAFKVPKNLNLGDISVQVIGGKLERKSIEITDGSKHSIVNLGVAQPPQLARIRVEYQLVIANQKLPWTYEFDAKTKQLKQHLTILNPLIEALPASARLTIQNGGVELVRNQIKNLGGSLKPGEERTVTRLVETNASLDQLWVKLDSSTVPNTAVPRTLTIDHQILPGQIRVNWPAGNLQISDDPPISIANMRRELTINAVQPFASPLKDPLCCGTEVCRAVKPALYEVGKDDKVKVQSIVQLPKQIPLVIGLKGDNLIVCETQTHRVELLNQGPARELAVYREEADWRLLPFGSQLPAHETNTISVNSVKCLAQSVKKTEFSTQQLYDRHLQLMTTGKSTINSASAHLLLLNADLANEVFSLPRSERLGKLKAIAKELRSTLKKMAENETQAASSRKKVSSLKKQQMNVASAIAQIHSNDDPDAFWRQLRQLQRMQSDLQSQRTALDQEALVNALRPLLSPDEKL